MRLVGFPLLVANIVILAISIFLWWLIISAVVSVFKAVEDDCKTIYAIEETWYIKGDTFCPTKD
jgi:hypothetical protein